MAWPKRNAYIDVFWEKFQQNIKIAWVFRLITMHILRHSCHSIVLAERNMTLLLRPNMKTPIKYNILFSGFMTLARPLMGKLSLCSLLGVKRNYNVRKKSIIVSPLGDNWDYDISVNISMDSFQPEWMAI